MITSDAGNTDYWGLKSNNYNMGTGPYTFIITDARNDSVTLGPVVACSAVAPTSAGITGVLGYSSIQFPPCGPTWTPGPTHTITNTTSPTRTYTPGPPTMTNTPSSPTVPQRPFRWDAP